MAKKIIKNVKPAAKTTIKGKGSSDENKKKKTAIAKASSVKKISTDKKIIDKKKIPVKHKEAKTPMPKKKTPVVVPTPLNKEISKITPGVTEHLKGKSVAHIKGYSKKDLEHFKKIILEKRDEIIEQLQNLKEQMLDPTTGEYINENSPYSLHMAEQGTDAMEREKTFLYAQRENKFLGYLEDALKRIDSGTYGICIECIDEPQHLCETCPLVPKARLEAVPHSQLCLPIKQRQEKR